MYLLLMYLQIQNVFTCIYCISMILNAPIMRITCISLYLDVPVRRITKIHEVVPSVVSRGISTLVLVTQAYIIELGLLDPTKQSQILIERKNINRE